MAVQTPQVANVLNRNGCRSGASHCDERGTTQRRDPFTHGSRRKPRPSLANGGRVGFEARRSSSRERWKGLEGASNPGPPRERPQGRGGARRERSGEQWDPSPVAGADSPGVSRFPSCSGLRRSNGASTGSTQARSQLENIAPIAVRVDNGRSRWPPSLPPGAPPGSQDPGGVGP